MKQKDPLSIESNGKSDMNLFGLFYNKMQFLDRINQDQEIIYINFLDFIHLRYKIKIFKKT